MSYTVYMHKNKLNNKIYVGITSRKYPKDRWGKFGSGYKNSYFGNAINKYGWDNFEHILLNTNINKDEAIKLEKEYIAKYNSNNPEFGYNLTSGGELTEFNSIACEKIRVRALGRKATPETIEILRKSHLGNKLSKETISKMLLKRVGFKHSEKSKQLMGEKALGGKFSEEHLQNLSKSHKGKKYSDEYKLNMRKVSPLSIRVKCVETGKVFYSYYHAAEEMFGRSKCAESISKCARGIKKSYNGFHFVKLDKEE